MVFFPVELSIALTGVVHFFNNIFKLGLVGHNANKQVLIKFGIPAVLAAFLGASILINLPDAEPLFYYNWSNGTIKVYPVKFIISLLLLFFAIIELTPYFRGMSFEKNKLPIGGLLSGFFGGLSGNQGALRSAFLIKAGLSKEAFVGTAVVVSTSVDFTRLGVYASQITSSGLIDNITLVLCATLSGITGSFVGHRLLKKVTMRSIQIGVAILLIVISVGLALGLI